MNKIIIAGGNGLIGSALVRAFREKGAEVICADIRRGYIQGPEKYFNMKYPGILDLILEKYNPVNGFVNCVYPKDMWTATTGWIRCTEVVAEYFSKNGGGSIVNFGSIYGMVGPQEDLYENTDIEPPSTEYAFIKGGIITASKHIAIQYAKYGVRCNVISPGGVLDNQPKEFIERYSKRCPMGRMAMPEDLVELVWLLLNQGSEYISGVNFPIDGGWTAI